MKSWENITPETLTEYIENLIVNNCEPKNSEKKTKEGKPFMSNSRIPRTVRLQLRRKKLASRAIKKVKTVKGCRHLREKIEEAEAELSKLHFKFKIEKENKAIEKMNSKYFYTFVRNKINKKNNVGPFVDKKGNIINDKPANTLQEQYESVWSVPMKEKIINDPDEFFNDNNDDHKPTITNVSIEKVKIRKAIMKLKNNAAPGPDGIPVSFLKSFVDYLLEPLEIIYCNSMENKILPEIWKLMYISPIRKPGKPK